MRVKGISKRSKNGSNGNTQVYRLPCKTQVATGFCPYRQRCQFLHDHRLAGSVSSKLRMDKSSHRVSTEEDSFFWPMQPSFSSTNTHSKQEYNIRRNGIPMFLILFTRRNDDNLPSAHSPPLSHNQSTSRTP